MRLSTHYIFSAGLISLALMLTKELSFTEVLAISFFVSFIGNKIIDGLGHEIANYNGKTYPRRTPLTHTVPRSVAWGLITVLPIIATLYYFNMIPLFLPVLIAGLIVGPSHMFLDIFTEAGIYAKKNGKWKRVAFAHFSYDNAFVNGLASIAGFLMLFLAFKMS